jgi:hypothetical protein
MSTDSANKAINELDAARKAVRDHITKCGQICDMSEEDYVALKKLNQKVTECQNEAFDYHTVEIKS